MYKLRKICGDTSAYAQYVGAIVAVLVVILVGIVIFYKISGSLNGLPADGVVAAAGVNSSAATIFSLMPVIGLVLIAGIIIAAVTAFGGGGKRA